MYDARFVPCPRCKTRNSAFNPTCIGCGAVMEEPRTLPASSASEPAPVRPVTARRGERLAGYEIEEPIGAGNTGSVWRARHATTGEQVALKVLHAHLVSSVEARARFLREARALLSVSHPSLGGIRQVVDEPPLLALVLEHVDGAPLTTTLAAGPLGAEEARALLGDMARGLAALHAAGLVHRDLKPDNVIVSKERGARVIDLGLVRALESRPGSMRTAGGVLLGSLAYSAPELVLGEPATAASDAWSLGVLGFEMLTGDRPFVAPSRAALAAAILGETPAFARLPSALSAVIEGLLRREPALRREALATLLEPAPQKSSSPA